MAPISHSRPPTIFNSGHRVFVLGGTNNVDAVDMSLRRPGRFDSELDMPPPSASERQIILQRRFERLRHSLTEAMVRAVHICNIDGLQ